MKFREKKLVNGWENRQETLQYIFGQSEKSVKFQNKGECLKVKTLDL